MYYPTSGSSAYKAETGSSETKTKKKRSSAVKKTHRLKLSTVIVPVIIFACMFTALARYVQIYGMHDEIIEKTAQLDKLKMENDQLALDIETLTDSSRVEQYATEKLGLKKMDSNQIVYLKQSTEDDMEKIASSKKSVIKGIFGLFSGVAEYLN